MVIYGDYHSHTTYSDGQGSIMESAIVAKNKGLKEIAITDHGFNKMGGMKREYLDRMRKECDEATKKTGVRVFLGVEANIISKNGDVDLTDEDIKKLDLIVVGFHQIVKGKTLWDKLSFILPNNLKIKTKRTIKRNTRACIMALEKYPIDILSHPGVGCPIDAVKVGLKAKELNTKMEINTKRIAYTDDEIKQLVDNKVEFIIDSDGHKSERIGKCDKAINYMLRHKIPFELVSNYGHRPNFRFNKGV